MDADTKRLLIIATHLSQFFAFLLFPLVIFLAVTEKTIKEHAKEVLNWTITLCLYGFICGVLFITIIGIPFALIGFAIIAIIGIIFPIIGAIKASEGKVYRYPLTIRFI